MPSARRYVVPLAASLALWTGAAAAQIAPTTAAQPAATPPAGPVTPPRLRRFVPATYPPAALAQGLEGAVLLQLSIDAAGRVTAATVLEPLGNGFDEAAVAAARQFEFEPATRDGAPTAVALRYRYRFRAEEARAAQAPRVRALLRGVVRGAGDRPLAGATVTLTVAGGPPRTATTGADGAFRFELDATGAARARVTAPGHVDLRATEAVSDREDVEVVWRLAPLAGAAPTPPPSGGDAGDDDLAGEATIRGRRPPREVTRRSLEFAEIRRMPGTGGDALRAVQNFPGVARSITGLLIVRGTTPQDTQIFADGTLFPLVYHFGGLSSVISSELLERIDFYPGNFSARFGRAQGGIVDVGVRSPRRQGYRAVVNVNLIDASVFVEGPITRTLSFAVSARRSYVDAVLGAVLPDDGSVRLTTLPVYYDYQAVLEWRPTTRDRVRLGMFGSDDAFALLFDRPNDMFPRFVGSFSTGISFHTGQLIWDHRFSESVTNRVVASLGYNSINFGGGDAFGLDLGFLQYTLRDEVSWQLSRVARLNTGLDLLGGPASIRFNGFRPPTEGQQVTSLNDVPRVATNSTETLYRPAAYAEVELTPVPSLRLVPGVRVDYTRDAGRAWTVSPRFAFRWEFFENWFLKGGLGQFMQPPQPQQSAASPNAFQPDRLIGNPGLRPQRSVHYALGVERNFSRYVSLSVEGFYKTLDDQIVAQPGVLDVPYRNTGVGRVYGAEVLLRHRPSSRFFGWVAYTLSRSERRDDPAAPWRVFQFDQTHILTVIASYTLGRGWIAGLRFRLVTGNPTTPVAGSLFNADTGTYQQLPGASLSTRNDAFHQLDLRIDKTWTFTSWNLNLYLEVLNVYNRVNPEGVQYNYNFTQSQSIGGLPIFPNLGVRAEF